MNTLKISDSAKNPNYVQHTTKAALNVHAETNLQRLTDHTVNKRFHHLFRDAK